MQCFIATAMKMLRLVGAVPSAQKFGKLKTEEKYVKCPRCAGTGEVETVSPSAERALIYMRREAPKRGGYMYEGARPKYETGEYKDKDLDELLAANLIAPHPDPNKGWVVVTN